MWLSKSFVGVGMQKEEIVLRFIENKHLLTQNALELLETCGEDYIIKNQNKLVLTQDDFNQEIKILKNITTRNISTEDLAKEYQTRYQKLKEILTAKLKKDLISINKIPKSGDAWIVGLVKNVSNNSIEIEDQTGSISIRLTEDIGAEADDVIAMKIAIDGTTPVYKEVVYPDVPLKQPTTGHGKACFISDLHLDEAPTEDIRNFFKWLEMSDIKYLFVAGGIDNKEEFSKIIQNYCQDKTVFIIPDKKISADNYVEHNIIPLSNPSMVELNGVKILLVHEFKQTMLRKRYISRGKNVLADLVLGEVPDIVHCGDTEPMISNYKSITTISSGSLLTTFKPVVVYFDSREATFVKWRRSDADADAGTYC